MNTLELLQKLAPDAAGGWAPGRLVVETEIVPKSEDACRRFLDFGGEGWLCLAGSKDIIRFTAGSPAAADAGWPLCGESANGAHSLHLQRVGEGWSLTTLTESTSGDPDELMCSATLQARDGKGNLCYRVCWRRQSVHGQDEIRPDTFRFTGFDNIKSEVHHG